MAERKYYQRFKDKMMKADPDCFCYKIPDTFKFGGKKPFDFFLVRKGTPFAIEFKDDKESATGYQKVMLRLFKLAGGISIVFKAGEMTIGQLVSEILRRSS